MEGKNNLYIDRVFGRYKSGEFMNLIKKWTDDLEHKIILKTDLFEEAFGEDQILFSLPHNARIFGLDISQDVVTSANIRNMSNGTHHNYLRADVRHLPLKNNVFDLIISSSTLDHFALEDDLLYSLQELKRVVKPNGFIIIAFNNKYNLNFYISLQLGRLCGLIPYPVQFYSISRLKKIFGRVGLSIQDKDSIVHIISPLNRTMLLLRNFISNSIMDGLSERCVELFQWLNRRRSTRFATAWFITLKCRKWMTN